MRLGGDPANIRPATESGHSTASLARKPLPPVNPLTPPWLVPVPGQLPVSESWNETVENKPLVSNRDKATVDLESDIDIDSVDDPEAELDTDFDI